MANKNKNNNDPAAATTATLAHHLRQFLTDPIKRCTSRAGLR